MVHVSQLRERLKEALTSCNLQQREFARLADVSESTVSNIMLGRDPRYSTYTKIESALNALEKRNDPAA